MKKVVIIGGGPIGLYAGIKLIQAGIDCIILEKRKEPVPDSRSLGIHPVSLKLLDGIGILNQFLSEGIKIKTGHAFTNMHLLGSISFTPLPAPFNYILSCPQSTTESLLRAYINELKHEALITQAVVQKVSLDKEPLSVHYSRLDEQHHIDADYVLVCDGKNSSIRPLLNISFDGMPYPDTYIMGDFDDNTPFGDDAAVYLPPEGMIECFPLPNKMRRWVAKTSQLIKQPTANHIAEIVHNRLDFNLHALNSTMISAFGVQHYLAQSFIKHRCILLGDAAHVVSPIGGQGMNLGWMGADQVTNILSSVSDSEIPETLQKYDVSFRKVVKRAARNAEINMKLGRKQSYPLFRNLAIKAVLNSPLQTLAAKQFTMLSLKR